MLIQDARPYNDSVYTIHACSRESLPELQADFIELCTMREFADMCAQNECAEEEVFLGFIRCTSSDSVREDDFLYAGKGGYHPRIKSVLSEFSDVLLSKLPPEIPPERYALDGKTIEHTIELALNSKPFVAQPRRLTQDEDAELRKVLQQLLENG